MNIERFAALPELCKRSSVVGFVEHPECIPLSVLHFWLGNTRTLRRYWETIPAKNVVYHLEDWVDNATGTEATCNTVACLGGWCCFIPEFVALGLHMESYCPAMITNPDVNRSLPRGLPSLHQEYALLPGGYASHALFGAGRLFSWATDEEIERSFETKGGRSHFIAEVRIAKLEYQLSRAIEKREL